MEMRKIYLIIIILVLFCTPSSRSALLFPANSVMQLVSSVSVPIIDLPLQRRIFFDWGIQMNYVLPFDLVSFNNSPLWPGIATPNTTRRSERSFVPRNIDHFPVRKHESYLGYKDFNALELYRGFEQLLNRYGYHRTCLLRSICELAQHPFDEREPYIFSDILNFLLSPLNHQGFGHAERVYRETYEDAERRGINGENCRTLYADCDHSFLDLISTVSNE